VLFEVLFAGEVGNLFFESLREAKKKPDRGLRVKLRTQAPELAALPWEFLHDPRRGDFVCLSHTTPLVRYLELPHPPEALGVTPPLRILGMIASPSDLPALDVAREKQRMDEALADPRREGLVDITWLPGQTWQALTQALGRGGGGPWHVFHFIGHGGFNPATKEGHIALATDEGKTYAFTAMQLSRLLGDHETLRLAVLNACEGATGSSSDLFSSTAAILVRRGLPAVVSMQYEISDQAAIQFAREFYRTLAHGTPVDAAVAEARKAVSFALPQSVEWGTPVLHMRSPDGNLFRLGGRTSGGAAPSAAAPVPQASEEQVASGRVRPSTRIPIGGRGVKVLAAAQMAGLAAAIVMPWILGYTEPLTPFASNLSMPWAFLSVTGLVLAWLSLRQSIWSGVLLACVAPAYWLLPGHVYWEAVPFGIEPVLALIVAGTSGATLLRRLSGAESGQPPPIAPGPERVIRLWSYAQTAGILAALIPYEITPAHPIWWTVTLSGALLGLMGLRYEIWPAVMLGWLAAVVSAPYLVFSSSSRTLLLLLSISCGVVALVLCVWTLKVLRRRRQAPG